MHHASPPVSFRANHGWKMITLYCCTGASEPLPSSVAVPRETQGQPDVALELELSGKAIADLYEGDSLRLIGRKGRISLVGVERHEKRTKAPSKRKPRNTKNKT